MENIPRPQNYQAIKASFAVTNILKNKIQELLNT